MTDSRSFHIRHAAVQDIDRLLTMRFSIQRHIESINRHLLALAPDAASSLATSYRQAIESDDACILVGETGSVSGPFAMAMGRVLEQPQLIPSRMGRIDDVWVDPAFRRMGVCRALVKGLVEFFASLSVTQLVLDHIVGAHDAEAMWTRWGFEPVLTICTAPLEEVASHFA